MNGFATILFVQGRPFFAIQFPIIVQSNNFISNRETDLRESQQDSTCFRLKLTRHQLMCAARVETRQRPSRRKAEVMNTDSLNLFKSEEIEYYQIS